MSNKVRFTFTFARGPRPEPPVNNEEHLENFARYGIWVRAITVFRLISDDVSGAEMSFSRVTTKISLFEQLGMFYEDVISTIIA